MILIEVPPLHAEPEEKSAINHLEWFTFVSKESSKNKRRESAAAAMLGDDVVARGGTWKARALQARGAGPVHRHRKAEKLKKGV